MSGVAEIIRSLGSSSITQFVEGILMEHVDMKNSMDSGLQVYFLCFVKVRSEIQEKRTNLVT